ncbi:NAD(P)H-dependent oxidoreductase [Helicobacter valdiviensis]|uniref:NAD(P)H-dependent oxidoreductase n=1 Tax=Helicobacter valdiviensis TaxID=1458358 RepID=A0A2W6MW92_9HELI|nr:NAD(P)H-dependent oxidoreductase [Helicobacter valdiviensis]PZT48612.1 NAD(P)H-dependent oxidoreductase [Helicobacter valdiviensis]
MKEEYQKIVTNRYSCREFKQEAISKEDLEYILEAGRNAPSSLGLEPWKFVVVQNDAKKKEISQIAYNQPHVANNGALIILLTRLDFAEYFEPKLRARNMPLEEIQKRLDTYKPFLEGMNETQKYAYAKEQTHLALMNLANAASALGLGSCIIGGFDNAKLDTYLKLDTKKYKSSVMLVIGKKKNEEIPPKLRFAFDEVVEFLE